MYTTLVLSAGGIRGVAYAGALQELVESGVLDLESITLFAGTSIGAAVACFLAVGFTPDELYEMATTIDLNDLVQINLASLLYKWGLDDQRHVREFLSQRIEKKVGDPKISFATLRVQRGCNLRVCSSNITTNKPVYFCADTAPDMPIIDAVLMRRALPPLFTPIRYGGDECNPDMYIDGAFLDSFPVAGLDPTTTIGLRLRWDVAFDLNSIERYFSRICFVALNFAEKHGATAPSSMCVVDIDAGDVSTINFQVPRWTILQLIRDGRQAVQRKFRAVTGPAGLAPCAGVPSI